MPTVADILKLIYEGDDDKTIAYLSEARLIRNKDGALWMSGELKEFIQKLRRFGLEQKFAEVLDEKKALSKLG